MKISKWEFENELNGLINAAKGAVSKKTALSYLVQAENKINGYDNIPWDLQQEYRDKIDKARQELNL